MSAYAVTPECPPACAGLLRPLPGYTAQHASGCCHYRNPHGKAWCKDCRRRVQIEDVSTESTYVSYGELAYRVEYLACGHTNEVERGVIGAAPGAPEPLPRSYELAREDALTFQW